VHCRHRLFFVVDLAFFSSNLLKLFQGGWFPLVIGGAIFTLMMTWKQGRAAQRQKLRADAIDLKSFLEAVFVSPPARVEGSAVFLTAEPGTVPNAMLHNLKHNKVLHEHNLFVTVRNHEVPWIGWTSAWPSSRWATTAGRWWCTTASRTTPTCRARWSRSAGAAASWSR
jgi:K+ transporter